jgi:hypothetical protein
MTRHVEVLSGVLILRRIAASHVAASHAQSKMNPRIAHLQALFAPVSVRADITNRIEMSTFGHGVTLLVLKSDRKFRISTHNQTIPDHHLSIAPTAQEVHGLV